MGVRLERIKRRVREPLLWFEALVIIGLISLTLGVAALSPGSHLFLDPGYFFGFAVAGIVVPMFNLFRVAKNKLAVAGFLGGGLGVVAAVLLFPASPYSLLCLIGLPLMVYCMTLIQNNQKRFPVRNNFDPTIIYSSSSSTSSMSSSSMPSNLLLSPLLLDPNSAASLSSGPSISVPDPPHTLSPSTTSTVVSSISSSPEDALIPRSSGFPTSTSDLNLISNSSASSSSSSAYIISSTLPTLPASPEDVQDSEVSTPEHKSPLNFESPQTPNGKAKHYMTTPGRFDKSLGNCSSSPDELSGSDLQGKGKTRQYEELDFSPWTSELQSRYYNRSDDELTGEIPRGNYLSQV